ncbi:TPA: DNA-directed RNA polymerase [Clostridioides difficile]|nr:DNA-directed RNA polymerase [Clostridioides difficile]HDJ1470943.1 DNA-directed RNA polymerase [Clostridioides difficile]
MDVLILCSYCEKEIIKYENKYIIYNKKGTHEKISICTNCALTLLETVNKGSDTSKKHTK